ncbi:GNAT family N-acetyltransferase [Salipiger abyssi]|uniref:Acetyltransferase, ribosomal protein N-acetylase n=1 Tax=Salipiger abyssi TaxID=1250539 RepID=A0A1P8UUC5_9RHOB|nr:GNAT family N-acetyltransferase [Salipiger abyssi]APZ53001.1 acetyltransferase, ribosomal protein N-acetylase [Salipiger abyssi]
MSLHQFPQLATDRLILSAPGAADQPAMLSFLGSERAQFYGGPMETVAAWHKFSAYVGQWVLRGYGFYAIRLKDSGETIGMAGPHHPEGFAEPEMSWLLTDAAYEGKGYAREACEAVLRDLFETRGWDNVVSYIDTANAASRALALRLGARLDETGAPCPLPGCESFRHFAPGSSPEARA